MSVQAMGRVMEFSEATAVNRLVLLVMANRAGGDFDECFASVDRLAFECRVDVRTVQRAVKRLTKAGELVPVGIHPKHRTNIYRVMPATTAKLFTSAGVAESHPPGASTPPAPPERKELGVRGRSTASVSALPTSGFAEFYEEFPRHMKPRDAKTAYKAALRRTDHATIMSAVRRLNSDPNMPAKEHLPYPATWLRADGWLNEEYPSHRNGNGKAWSDPAGPGMRTAKRAGVS